MEETLQHSYLPEILVIQEMDQLNVYEKGTVFEILCPCIARL